MAEGRGRRGRDITAGLTNAVANIPDAMANAILAGTNPVYGLYSLATGTPIASLLSASPLMTVAVTGSMALMVGDALTGVPGEERVSALVVIALLVGAFQIALGVLKAGTLLRFVSNAVIRGFMTGVAVNIVLSQIAHLTGGSSDATGRVLRAIDVLLHPSQMNGSALLVSGVTVGVILLLERTRLQHVAFVLALVVATLVSLLPALSTETVGDLGSIPRALPTLVLPDTWFQPQLVLPAAAIAVIGLLQGAAVSRTVPNADGTYPDVNRDFWAQGASNVAAGFFGGLPVGGSVSSTALLVQLGAKGRLANLIVGPFVLLVLLLFGPVVETVPLSCLAAILVLVGIRAINVPAIETVWRTSAPSATIMASTFLATLFMPIQYAVMLGMFLSVVQHVYSSSLDVRLVELRRGPDGVLQEYPCPSALESRSATLVDIYGSVFYAGADTIEKMLPDPAGAERPVVILRLRGRDDVGSTFIGLLRRYSARLEAAGGKLMLGGVSEKLMQQLERTGVIDQLGRENVYAAQKAVTATAIAALNDAEAWLRNATAQPSASERGERPVRSEG